MTEGDGKGARLAVNKEVASSVVRAWKEEESFEAEIASIAEVYIAKAKRSA